jgi:hypothetical protein
MRMKTIEAPTDLTTASFGPAYKPEVLSRSHYIEILDPVEGTVHRCHYYKQLFSKKELADLAFELKSDSRRWEVKGETARILYNSDDDEDHNQPLSDDDQEEDTIEEEEYVSAGEEYVSAGEETEYISGEEEGGFPEGEMVGEMEGEGELGGQERGGKRAKKKQGGKSYIITGEWNALGHCRPNIDPIYPAGKAGKLEVKRGSQTLLNKLSPFAQKASVCVRKHRPDVDHLVGDLTFPFDRYHLFMCTKGGSGFHRDPNDIYAFIFVIECDDSASDRGMLEIGGVGVGFKFGVGDAIMVDSKALEHGTVGYLNKGRMVGIFIVHRSFLYLHGVDKQQVYDVNKG